MRSPCRDASCVRSMGGGAPKGAVHCGVRLRCRRRQAPSGAPSAAFLQHRAPLRLPAMAGRSASSWQGLLVVPGGAPMPPECLVATRPAGAAPRPASRRLMIAPLSGRGGCIVSEIPRAGIMWGKTHQELVIPAQAGIQGQRAPSQRFWIPAFAGMTEFGFSPEATISRGVGDSSRPTRRARSERATLPVKGRDGVRCTAQAKQAALETGMRRCDGTNRVGRGVSFAATRSASNPIWRACTTGTRREAWTTGIFVQAAGLAACRFSWH